METDAINIAGMKEKRKKKRISEENEKTTRNQITLQKSHPKDEYLGCLTRKILGTIITMDQRRPSTIGPENKKTHDDAKSIQEMT